MKLDDMRAGKTLKRRGRAARARDACAPLATSAASRPRNMVVRARSSPVAFGRERTRLTSRPSLRMFPAHP